MVSLETIFLFRAEVVDRSDTPPLLVARSEGMLSRCTVGNEAVTKDLQNFFQYFFYVCLGLFETITVEKPKTSLNLIVIESGVSLIS